ncbi:hypothetical protein T4A_13781 [Trichinella pseudospiralis]|uniref:Uncharacterized protein n=1 Tax=Trichinella pseudospiralis TaxID=6337 RepID=A0A0V1EBL6_TRIPS|nr:hypothetical protein T4A_13781 [Trichinella pseudospiralis]
MKSIKNAKEKKNKNADDTVHKFIDGTKQIKRKQEACMISWAFTNYGGSSTIVENMDNEEQMK